MRRALPWALLIVLVTLAAAVMRFSNLDNRTMHGDEAVNAVKFKTLLEDGRYQYDPHQYHGPSLYYALWPIAEGFGPTDWRDIGPKTYRALPVMFSLLVILTLLLVGDAIGWRAAAAAAVLAAVSTSMVFVSRYFIHETLLVAFSFGVIAMAWRYARHARPAWAVGVGAFAGLMFATKETTVITWFAMAVGIIAAAGVPKVKRSHLIAGTAAFVAVSIALFSSLGTHWPGVVDSVRAFADYTERGLADDSHTHPWWYYLRMLAWHRIAPGPVWTEGLIVALAIIGAVTGWRSSTLSPIQRRFVRFTAVYALTLAVVYSAIPYKTPWLVITFVQPAIVLAGLGAVVLIRWVPTLPGKAVVGLVLAALTVQLGLQTHRSITRFAEDQRNPYVYAHPSHDLRRLVDYLDKLVPVHPRGRAMVVKVVVDNPWPLPWYLRRFERVGYWDHPPADPDADIVIVQGHPDDPSLDLTEATLAAMTDPKQYAVSRYGLRHGVVVNVLVRQQWYDALIDNDD
jgi:uncharacterized protein (TIGR03663 family)